MASSGKRKTTMAKLTRERRLHERRIDKQARKEARKLASANEAGQPSDELTADLGEPAEPGAEQPDLEPVVRTPPTGDPSSHTQG
jgi:hypothetical protein